jgi:hypothetical protein
LTPRTAALAAGVLTFVSVGPFITLAMTGTEAPNMAQQIAATTLLIGTARSYSSTCCFGRRGR